MSAVTWALFIPACFAINMAPGLNKMLAFSNAARFGFNHAMPGVFGRLLAFALMIWLVFKLNAKHFGSLEPQAMATPAE